MNIGLFTDSYYPEVSGLVSSIEVLQKELKKRGHNVYIFTTTSPDEKTSSENVFRLPSMPFIFLKSRRIGLFYAPKAASCVKQLKIDVVHTQTEFSLGMFGKIMSKQLDIPVVHTYHTLYKEYFYYISKGYFKRLSDDIVRVLSRNYCNGCNAIIAPTEKVYDLLKDYDVEKPINIIPTGIEIGRFDKDKCPEEKIKELKLSLGISEDDKVILFIGRVAKEKSIDVIIRQMPKIINKVPNAKLVIVGDGMYREDLEEMIDELNISDSVIFTGEVPWEEVAQYYRLGDVFVSSSLTETQGLTFIEAMASDVPVVARLDKSIESLIENGKNGVVFRNEHELAEIIIKILTNKEFSDALVKNAKETVLSYSAEEFGKNVEKVYFDVVEKSEKKITRKMAKMNKKSK